MKHFLLFAGDNYYPMGGWLDYVDTSDSLEFLKDLVKARGYGWYQIIDTLSQEVIDKSL